MRARFPSALVLVLLCTSAPFRALGGLPTSADELHRRLHDEALPVHEKVTLLRHTSRLAHQLHSEAHYILLETIARAHPHTEVAAAAAETVSEYNPALALRVSQNRASTLQSLVALMHRRAGRKLPEAARNELLEALLNLFTGMEEFPREAAVSLMAKYRPIPEGLVARLQGLLKANGEPYETWQCLMLAIVEPTAVQVAQLLGDPDLLSREACLETARSLLAAGQPDALAWVEARLKTSNIETFAGTLHLASYLPQNEVARLAASEEFPKDLIAAVQSNSETEQLWLYARQLADRTVPIDLPKLQKMDRGTSLRAIGALHKRAPFSNLALLEYFLDARGDNARFEDFARGEFTGLAMRVNLETLIPRLRDSKRETREETARVLARFFELNPKDQGKAIQDSVGAALIDAVFDSPLPLDPIILSNLSKNHFKEIAFRLHTASPEIRERVAEAVLMMEAPPSEAWGEWAAVACLDGSHPLPDFNAKAPRGKSTSAAASTEIPKDDPVLRFLKVFESGNGRSAAATVIAREQAAKMDTSGLLPDRRAWLRSEVVAKAGKRLDNRQDAYYFLLAMMPLEAGVWLDIVSGYNWKAERDEVFVEELIEILTAVKGPMGGHPSDLDALQSALVASPIRRNFALLNQLIVDLLLRVAETTGECKDRLLVQRGVQLR